MNTSIIAVLGAGSWGTAMAIHLAKHGYKVLLWGRDLHKIAEYQRAHRNTHYLPQSIFPPLLEPVAELEICQAQATDLLLAIPSHGFANLIKRLKRPASGIAWLTKGLNPEDNALLSEVVFKHWGPGYPIAIVSGPSFAAEVVAGLPTAVTLASNNADYQHRFQKLLHHDNFRVYLSRDLIGVQLCGAVKNVIAIACGVSDGLGYGANARAALITRGLAEMWRLGQKMGAEEDTFLGLAGVGDTILTCTDNQSRNRRFGLLLGQGKTMANPRKVSSSAPIF